MNRQDSLAIEGRPSGPLLTVTYCLTDQATGRWALVDPTYDVALAWRDRFEETAPPEAIYLTHGHFDHAAGLSELLRRWPGIPIWIHPDGAPMIRDLALSGARWAGLPYDPVEATDFYREGDEVSLGESRLRVIEAPGHCPGSVLLLSDRHLLAGDVLFRGGVGRWDLPMADYETLARSIRQKVMTLPDDTIVYPGHGPATTIGQERRDNFIVLQMLGEKTF